MDLLKACIVGGISLSSFHFIWILLVASGWAQVVLEYILKLHMLSLSFIVQPFNWIFSLNLPVTIALTTFRNSLCQSFAKNLVYRSILTNGSVVILANSN